MRNLISEDDIEQGLLQILESPGFKYDVIRCDADPLKMEDLGDGTERSNKTMCVLPKVLKESLRRLNPDANQVVIDLMFDSVAKDFTGTDMIETNYRLYSYLRNGFKVTFRENGEETFSIFRFIDFESPQNNTFTAVSQMWIKGHYNWRRPDVLIFVNGLPLVFIELKNSNVKVQEAYDNNLQNYRKDIPNLFALNQICVLSNGIKTRMGAFNAPYGFFFEWLRASEQDRIDRKQIEADGVSLRYLANSLFRKDTLVDYIENFVLFKNKRTKIIAMNHQFLGVNNLMRSVMNRKELKGKLGVFWHTQGSGKSFSMVMFCRKVKRKIAGNFSFLIITDREDLDNQIYKNFVRTEVIGDKDECQPKNGKQLRDYLQTNKEFIFTLIHKFNYDKTKQYPVLTTREDIFVLVDEAHRTQYKTLAENMRTALPNANFIAFTGTPLLGSKRLTNQWFGNYVSEYNFAQSVEDGSTVPIFYNRRVPEVLLQNNWLDTDVADIVESENLNDAETRLLENSSARILEVIKRDDRLEKIAQDIAYHFPRRGFLGKGMVVSVDKFTAVIMYNKVQHYWAIEKQKIVQERNEARTKEERDRLTGILDYMNRVEMAVIVSKEEGEDEKFAEKGLDITLHRKKMEEISPEGVDIEDRFKDPDDNLQLVFVCAMWLTGFDVPSLSTLYLDKPMKSHTLMQAIARANRVFGEEKTCGIVIDYVNVFKYMKQALSDYATGSDGEEFPAKDIAEIKNLLNQCVVEGDAFLLSAGHSLDGILAESNTLDRLEDLRMIYDDIVAKEELRNKFKVITNTLQNLYDAAKPEILDEHWYNEKFAALLYIHGLMCNSIDDEKVNAARRRMSQVLDSSIASNEIGGDSAKYKIHEGKVIDLSKMDIDELRKEVKTAEYKGIEIDDLKAFIEKTLQQMINRNCERIKFSERFKGIVDRYNAGGSENEDYYEQLLRLIEDLKAESSRADLEGLSEEELELYDLLIKGKKLTKKEEQAVKLAAKDLYTKLYESRKEILVVDWYKDDETRYSVEQFIQEILNQHLPDSYDTPSFQAKSALLMNHFIDMAVQGYGWIGSAA